MGMRFSFTDETLRRPWHKKARLPPVFVPLTAAVERNDADEVRDLCRRIATLSERLLFEPAREDGVCLAQGAWGGGWPPHDMGLIELACECGSPEALDAAVDCALEASVDQAKWCFARAVYLHAQLSPLPEQDKLLPFLERVIHRVGSFPALSDAFLEAAEELIGKCPSAAGVWRQGREELRASTEDRSIFDAAPTSGEGAKSPSGPVPSSAKTI